LACAALGCALALALASGGAAAESGWSPLWMTAPQRAQRLLDAGRPAEAARLFSDPKRRAYADLEAGRYAEAAKLLQPFEDPESRYNLGNALAHVGNLPGALAAYDAALAKAPRDRDAIHNRDLVERALEQRARKSGGRGSQGRQGQKGASGQQGNSGSAPRSSSAAGNRNGASQGEKSQSAGSRTGGSPSSGESPAQQAEQARADAELAERLRREGGKRGSSAEAGGTGTASAGPSSTQTVPPRSKAPSAGQDEEGPPLSEQTLALEQWLRRIPDDPGGLLRRKFLIEHLEREQQAQGAASDGDSQ
jgi:Ca-activated chloride channel homolog